MRSTWLFAFFFNVVCSYAEKNVENVIATTPLGQIEGTTMETRLGRKIYAFRGIRYAEPPVGDLRFEPPVPTGKWSGIYNATADAPSCPQFTSDPTSEDCLFLNVYTVQLPKQKQNPKFPVVIYLHPGAFVGLTGRSNVAGPKKFLDRDVVLVTFNYRLGTLGLLSTGDKLAPGNNALKDQVAAMRWVKANIAAFGGDPDSVTILGYSAGAVSVSMHLVSPMSKGLFHKAVVMSESITGLWTVTDNQLELAKKQAYLLGCPNDTSANIVNCLRTKSAKEILESMPKFAEFGSDPSFLWRPVVEKDFGQERFMHESPEVLMQKGLIADVPVIAGITEYEFGYATYYILNSPDLLNKLNNEWDKYAPITFIYDRDTEASKRATRGLRKFYFNDKPITNSSLNQLSEIYADTVTGFAVNRLVKLLSKYAKTNVYYYCFSYVARYSHFYLPGTNNTVPYGAVHHDDLIYFLSGNSFPLFSESDKESIMIKKMTTLLFNFAKYGNPIPNKSAVLDNVEWKPYDSKSQIYLDLGQKLVPKERLFEKRYNEFEKLFPLDGQL